MSVVSLYKNMIAEYGAATSYFTFGVDAGSGSLLSGFEMKHGYSSDPHTAARASGNSSAAIGYFSGGWSTVPDSDEFNALYLGFGYSPNCDLIDLQTSDPDFPSTWPDVTWTAVTGSEGVSGPVSSGIVIDQPEATGWLLGDFTEVSKLNRRFRLLFRKKVGESELGHCSVHHLWPLSKLDLPEPARTRVEEMFTYGVEKEYTLAGKSQYSSLGADVRYNIQINYIYLNESQKDLILSLYQSQRGSTYPFVVLIDDYAYSVIFTDEVSVVEEQADCYNITLNMESL